MSRHKHVPKGYDAVMPYLRVRRAAEAITFYEQVFGAEKVKQLDMGDRIGHAELDIHGSTVMLADEFPERGAVGPETVGGTTVTLVVYVGNVDKVVARAADAGAKVLMPPADMFYGARAAQIQDPFGHVWMIQTHLEDVSGKKMQKRLDAMMAAEADQPASEPQAGKTAAKATARKRTSRPKPA